MSHNENVGWIVELEIREGKFELFEELARDMRASTKHETGTLQYEWNMLDDNKTVIIIERYKDSDAALIHTRTFAEKFAERFNELAVQTRLFVYGVPDMTLRDVLKDAGAIFSEPI